jgi:hypothetical protein
MIETINEYLIEGEITLNPEKEHMLDCFCAWRVTKFENKDNYED